MHEVPETTPYLVEMLFFLAASVIAVPLFKRLGLGIVVGLLIVGIFIGPSGFGLFPAPEKILVISELGVVLLLFVIGLELEPARLWNMRSEIFLLGTSQVLLTAGLLIGVLLLADVPPAAAVIAGLGLSLSSTAFVLQLLQERGQLSTAFGRRAFGILLFQDMMIVPFMALLPLLSQSPQMGENETVILRLLTVAAAVSVVIVIGRYLLTPIFAILARAGGREVMLAAALLVSLGSATLLQSVGLSMALGAFLAGAMLAESNFRHTLAADIDPFRVILMGLFFISIGMALDLELVMREWQWVVAGIGVLMPVKAFVLWLVARIFGSTSPDSLRIAATLPQGSEFGFVLFSAALAQGVLTQEQSTLLIAVIIISMILTPLARAFHDLVAVRVRRQGVPQPAIQEFSTACPCVLIAGFGRFGMIVAQMLGSEDFEIIAIDSRVERIEHARKLGYKVYFGDAKRVDVLAAAGGYRASLIALCISQDPQILGAIESIRNRFPKAKLFCRAESRDQELSFIKKGVDFQIVETFESGLSFSKAALSALDIPGERIAEIEEDVRRRDLERLQLQLEEGLYAGSDRLHQKTPRLAPRQTAD